MLARYLSNNLPLTYSFPSNENISDMESTFFEAVVQSQSEREDELKTIKEKFAAMESQLEHQREMEQKLNQVISLIQTNPILSNVKPQALLTKRIE